MKGLVRQSDPTDLEAINILIESAVLAWPMAERVKRLSLPVLKYDRIDMQTLAMIVYEHGVGRSGAIAGVAAWAPETPASEQALLHGLYVAPDLQGQGIGRTLQRSVFSQARQLGMQAVVVRAERVSGGYFEKCGYAALPPSSEPGNAYPYRYWKPLAAGAAAPHPEGTCRQRLEATP